MRLTKVPGYRNIRGPSFLNPVKALIQDYIVHEFDWNSEIAGKGEVDQKSSEKRFFVVPVMPY